MFPSYASARHRAWLLLVCVGLCCWALLFADSLAKHFTSTAQADSISTWTGAVSTDWFTPGNWSPIITPTRPTEPAGYLHKQSVRADYCCADNLSGDDCVGTVPGGGLIDTGSVGVKTFAVRSADAAGNNALLSVGYVVS
jgi:hypothetical protein